MLLQDPEGILAAPKGGHISRRTFQKQLAEDQSLAERVEKEREQARKELQARRDVRRPTTIIIPISASNKALSDGIAKHRIASALLIILGLYAQARQQPTSHGELVEYLLTTEQPEMEYETARCRPLLTPEFMAFLQQEIGACAR
jgi:hypothetical protein